MCAKTVHTVCVEVCVPRGGGLYGHLLLTAIHKGTHHLHQLVIYRLQHPLLSSKERRNGILETVSLAEMDELFFLNPWSAQEGLIGTPTCAE